MHQYMLGARQLEGSLAEKDLGVPLDTSMNTGQRCAHVAKMAIGILHGITQSIASSLREVILYLYSALVRTQCRA